MSLTNDQIKKEYQANESVYDKFMNEVLSILNHDLHSNDIKLAFPISFRVKKLDSIIKKVNAKIFEPRESISEVQDIIGIRIVFLYKNDIPSVKRIIENHFPDSIIKDKSHHTRNNTFGYSTTHYICTPPVSWQEVNHLKQFRNLKVEIQLRTLSEHIWAECSHSLNYKSNVNIPKVIERPLIRLAAVLEIIDDELVRIKGSHIDYINTIGRLDIVGLSKQDLNAITLQQLLSKFFPHAKKVSQEKYSELNKIIEKDNSIEIVEYLAYILNKYQDEDFDKLMMLKEDVDHEDIVYSIMSAYQRDDSEKPQPFKR